MKIHRPDLVEFVDPPPELPKRLTLRMRLGPFPNELDAVRSLHRRQEVATPDDHSDVICQTCYIFDEGWPCTVARLIEVIDAQLAYEEAEWRRLAS